MIQDSGQHAPGETELTVAIVDDARWADLQQIFEGRGGPHYCWCMAWRKMPPKLRGGKAAKKAELKRRVEEGTPVGLLGYVEGNPVARCSVGPRASFRRLTDKDHCAPNESVWSIVCFFIHKDFRGQGFSARLIDAAIDYAKRNGADVV